MVDASTFAASSDKRDFNSLAALFVKVIAKIVSGFTPCRIKLSIRLINVLVLPDPAPAIIKTGPWRVSTASC